jgi:hypothetical protein
MTPPVEELLAEAPKWLLLIACALVLDHVYTATRRRKP